MPTLKIRNIHDAFKIVERYRLNELPDGQEEGPVGWTWHDFANWLFVRTNSVNTEELAAHIDAFEDDYDAHDTEAPTFSELRQLNADSIMEGVQVYERAANELMRIFNELTDTSGGRVTLEHIARAVTSRHLFSYLSGLSNEELSQVAATFAGISAAAFALDRGPDLYFPGLSPETDGFMVIDVCLLGETLSDEQLWRDDEEFRWPVEVYAVVRCAREYVATAAEFPAERATSERT